MIMHIYRQSRWLYGLSLLAASCCFAEQWEIGAAGGYHFARQVSVTRGTLTADAGFANGASFSVFAGHQWINRLGGELRYTYRDADPKLTSGGTKLRSGGHAQSVHYDALVHFQPMESRVRPFIAFGGGIKHFRGTGRETEFQGLDRVGVLSRTGELKPMASVGAGVKFRIAQHVAVRLDFRDQISPFPSKIVTPAAGASLRGWLHDLSPMVGISAVF